MSDTSTSGHDTPKRRSSLVVNAMSNWTALVVNIAIGFLLTPFIIAQLGQAGYGIWSLVGALLGCYGLLDLGVSSAVGRYVARYAAREDYDSLNSTVSTALAFFLGIGVLVAAGFALAAEPIGRAFLDPSEQSGLLTDFVWVLRLLGMATAVNLAGQVFRSLLLGHERFVQRNAISIGQQVLRAGLTVAVLLAGWGLLGVAAVTLLTDAIGATSYSLTARRACRHLHLSPAFVQWSSLRPLLTFGLTSSVIVAADLIRSNIDSMVIAWLVGVEAVAVYQVAMLLVRYAGRFVFHGMGVLTPRMAGLHGQDRHEELRGLVLRSLWVSSLLAGGGGMLLVALGRPFIRLWVGPDFSGAYIVLAVFAGATFAELAQLPAVNALYAMNRHRFLAVTRSGEAVANFILSIILVSRLGIVGVALGTLIPLLTVNSLIQPLYMSRLLKVSLSRFWLPQVSCLVPALLVLGIWEAEVLPHLDPLGWAGMVVAGVILSGVYLVIVFVVQAIGSDRPLPMGLLRRKFPAGAEVTDR